MLSVVGGIINGHKKGVYAKNVHTYNNNIISMFCIKRKYYIVVYEFRYIFYVVDDH